MSDSYKQSDKPDKGALFDNDRKETDKHPDMMGSLNVGEVDYFISAWKNEAQSSGKKYLKLSVTKKDKQFCLPGGWSVVRRRSANPMTLPDATSNWHGRWYAAEWMRTYYGVAMAMYERTVVSIGIFTGISGNREQSTRRHPRRRWRSTR